VIKALNAEVNKVLSTPEAQEGLAKLGVVPAGGTPSEFKAKIEADLKQSFAFLRAGIEKLTDADAEKRMPWFDGENTYRGVLYFFTRHTGEHTGQLIAYARVNGIVPPWSEGR
jgi:uncharacterized damage-inducible protein DinB